MLVIRVTHKHTENYVELNLTHDGELTIPVQNTDLRIEMHERLTTGENDPALTHYRLVVA